MKPLILLPRAEVDIFEAALWYESERAGLGWAFELDLDRTMVRIQESPLQFPELEEGVRRAMFERFPYGVFYVCDDGSLTVFAVLHLHRSRDTWRGRR